MGITRNFVDKVGLAVRQETFAVLRFVVVSSRNLDARMLSCFVTSFLIAVISLWIRHQALHNLSNPLAILAG